MCSYVHAFCSIFFLSPFLKKKIDPFLKKGQSSLSLVIFPAPELKYSNSTKTKQRAFSALSNQPHTARLIVLARGISFQSKGILALTKKSGAFFLLFFHLY